MFTGIIQELGVVQRIDRSGGVCALDIRSEHIFKDVKIGDSVSVNGVCLTIASKKRDLLNFDVMAETIRCTGLATLKNKDTINLEGSLKACGTIDGHFVLGHVDCVGVIKNVTNTSDERIIRINFPEEFGRLIVDKGSIAVDGVSLTVNNAGKDNLDVCIIPHTLKATTLNTKNAGDAVNLEFDILGKYVVRDRHFENRSRISEEFLRSKGF